MKLPFSLIGKNATAGHCCAYYRKEIIQTIATSEFSARDATANCLEFDNLILDA